jgi:hypothetical protein
LSFLVDALAGLLVRIYFALFLTRIRAEIEALDERPCSE